MLTLDKALALRFLEVHGPPGRLLLCAVTGSHIYGFPSPDSDIDLKGLHVLPTECLVGLRPSAPAHDRLLDFEGVECDLTTQELGVGLQLLVKGNGNMLERVLSPIQLVESPEVSELQELVRANLHRGFSRHYRGFFKGCQREHLLRPRAKSALYAYRVALTGLHLLRTGELVTDVRPLAAEAGYTLVPELVAFKEGGGEKVLLPDALHTAAMADWPRLEQELASAVEDSPLPTHAPDEPALEAWLLAQRQAYWR